jgi:hypothetical protein
MLVFGGDAPDKGSGDIRLVKTLLGLKKRFPQQAGELHFDHGWPK